MYFLKFVDIDICNMVSNRVGYLWVLWTGMSAYGGEDDTATVHWTAFGCILSQALLTNPCSAGTESQQRRICGLVSRICPALSKPNS